jgi:hypothetical protein
MKNPIFKIIPADNFIWNQKELIDFLIVHRGSPIELSTNQEGCCGKSIGVYQLLEQFKYTQVKLYTANSIEHHDKYEIIADPHTWKFLKVSKKIEADFQQWNCRKIFGTVFGRPIWHRIGIAAHLYANHADKSLVGFFSDPNNIDQRELFEIQKLFQNDNNSFINFANTLKYFPLRHSEVSDYAPGYSMTDEFTNQTKTIYQHFLIDIVAEPFTSGDCFFITEKTIRPMLLKKPMIVMASKNHLDYLHQMGFRTFSDFWSEEYDGFEERDRYLKILELIDLIAKKSINELKDMYMAMQYTLNHNYNLLMSQSYKNNIVKIN